MDNIKKIITHEVANAVELYQEEGHYPGSIFEQLVIMDNWLYDRVREPIDWILEELHK